MNFAKVPVSVLRTCLVQAVRNAQALALRFVQRAQVALQPLDSVPQLSGETALRAAAYQDLLKHHHSLVNGYPQALLETLLQAARQPFSSFATNGGADHLASCAPLDDAAHRQSLLRRQLQQELASQVELALADLDSLVSAAQGMARVQPESNPLRPENYLRALAQVIGSIPVDEAVAECWLQCMGRSLGSLLASEYARTAAYLREQGVVPALYGQPTQTTDALLRRRSDRTALQRPGWQAPPQYGDAMSQSRAYAAQHEDLLTLRVLQELISDPRWIDDNLHSIPQALTDSMLHGLGAPSQADWFGLNRTDLGVLSPLLAEPDVLQAGWTSYSATALETIQHHPSQVAQLFKAVEPAPTVSPQVRTLLRMMVHMTGDVRLQPAVQRVLRSLEPVLIQLVEFDGRFFEDSQHPARLLLDELTARSLWFPNEAAPGFAHFMQITQAAAVQLASLPTVDAQGFAYVLQHMREGWSRAGEHVSLRQPGAAPAAAAAAGLNRAPQQSSYHGPLSAALKFADEHRRSAHEAQAAMPDSAHIAQAIARLPSAQGVPEDILDFVTGPWAQVIASTQQQLAPQAGQSENDPGGYMALVPSLLWSVSAHACTDTRRLAMLAPRLQTRLANGLRSVGRTEAEIQALAARLAGLHQDALDAGLAQASSRPDITTEAGVLDMLPSMLGSLDGADETLQAPLQEAAVLNLPSSGAGVKERFDLSWQTRPIGVLESAFAGSPSAPAELPESWKKSAVAQLHKAQGATDFGVRAVSNSDPQTLFSRAELTSQQSEEEWALGCWVELSNERQQLRTRLTWVSPQQTLFLFTAADGSTQSMTRRMRDKLLAQGQLQRIKR
ncbi:DUF1631 domain-containing protein [Comamonas aquatilis]|uniref:DUF1631 family protein n=1 Tax=Comamonas aquatilis TaxID=1778406 RepID=UPI0039F0F31E